MRSFGALNQHLNWFGGKEVSFTTVKLLFLTAPLDIDDSLTKNNNDYYDYYRERLVQRELLEKQDLLDLKDPLESLVLRACVESPAPL